MKRSGRARPGGTASIAALSRWIVADSDAGILVLDAEGRVVDINPAAERLLAVRGRRALGRSGAGLVRTLVPGDDPVSDVLTANGIEREVLLATSDGHEVPVLLRSHSFGSPPRVALVLRDLTHAHRMREELRRRERLATLGQLSAGVAHEIRNPLAGIGTSAQVLLRRFEPRDERARFVRVILEEVERLDRIVTSLLQYARPRTPELKSGDLGACVERVLELSADAIAQAGVTVTVKVAPRLGPVYIDGDLVTQVMLNVTLNALQAMPQGGDLGYEVSKVKRRQPPRGPGRRATDAEGSVGHEVRKNGGGRGVEYQQVRISDTGTGIPRGALGKLFDPFFSTKPRGTGLGLSISQTIMQEHGGSIEVTSREGKGSTVLLNFPMEKRHGERRHVDAHPKRPNAARRRR